MNLRPVRERNGLFRPIRPVSDAISEALARFVFGARDPRGRPLTSRLKLYTVNFSMALDLDQETAEFIRSHRVARLATASVEGHPAVVPICYVFDGELIYTPIDEKPKSVAPGSLSRVRNIRANAHVAVVVDDYSEDWNELVYVMMSGTAEIVSPVDSASEHAHAIALLREKYPQYVSMRLDNKPIIKIVLARTKRWAAADKARPR